MRLKGKVAVITGASSGIGRSTAELFAEEGANVVAADIDDASGDDVVSSIRQRNGIAHYVHTDISKEADAERLAAKAVKAFGRIDILVNNAANFVWKGPDASQEDWRRAVDVNIIGTALVTKHVVKEIMKYGRGGAIVNLGSISGFIAQPDFLTYSATKGAILQMTRNMAIDFAPYGIRVNTVCPGTILTPTVDRYMEEHSISLDQLKAIEGAKSFLKRLGQPREVANAILFLASDEASYITGASLLVDGGYTAQ
jgi:dihydroanticapsin dehydrogenase